MRLRCFRLAEDSHSTVDESSNHAKNEKAREIEPSLSTYMLLLKNTIISVTSAITSYYFFHNYGVILSFSIGN